MAEVDAAWAAGFFDGEGCVGANNGAKYATSDGLKCRRYLRITVTQKTAPLLERCQRIFGLGNIYGYPARATATAGYSWTCNGRAAFHVLNVLWPFLGEQKKADFKRAIRTIRATRTEFIRQPQLGTVPVAVRKEL